MNELIGFVEINPNTRNSVFYYADTKNDYIQWLMYNSIYAVYTNDNYRIDNDIIRLSKDQNKNAHMKYFYDENTEAFYNVIDVQTSSNYYEYRVKKDYWGTYINEAHITKFNIQRSNRQIENLGYGEILKHTTNVYEYIPLYNFGEIDAPFNIKESKFEIVILVSFETDTSLIGLEKATRTALMTASLSQMRSAASQYSSAALVEAATGIMLASDLIGGIYEADCYQSSTYKKAAILGAYIVPADTIEFFDTMPSVVFHTKSFFTHGNDVDLAFQYVKPKMKSISCSYQCNLVSNWYVGTLNNGLQFAPRYSLNYFEYKFIYSSDNLRVIVCEGDIQKDITSSFTLSLTTNNQTASTLEKQLKGIQIGTDVLKSAITALGTYASGNVIGAYTSVVNTGVDVVKSIKGNASLTHNINGGDAAATYYTDYDTTYLANPFILMSYEATDASVVDEQILNYGYAYDNLEYYITKLTDLTTYNLSNLEGKDYLQADAIIDNLPCNAADFIITELHNGITLQFI